MTWHDGDGVGHAAEVVGLPFFDTERRLLGGLARTDSTQVERPGARGD